MLNRSTKLSRARQHPARPPARGVLSLQIYPNALLRHHSELSNNESGESVRKANDNDADNGVTDSCLRFFGLLLVPLGGHPQVPGVNDENNKNNTEEPQENGDDGRDAINEDVIDAPLFQEVWLVEGISANGLQFIFDFNKRPGAALGRGGQHRVGYRGGQPQNGCQQLRGTTSEHTVLEREEWLKGSFADAHNHEGRHKVSPHNNDNSYD